MHSFLYKMTRLHWKLEEAIRSERRRRFPDDLRLLRLKKVRLQVKDRLRKGFVNNGFPLPTPVLSQRVSI